MPLTPPPPLTPEHWSELNHALAEADRRLVAVLQNVWTELTEVISTQQGLIDRIALRPPGSNTREHRTAAARESLESGVTTQMNAALDALRGARSGERVLAALATWDRDALQWLRALPERGTLSGRATRELARRSQTALGWRAMAALDPRSRTLELRRLVSAAFHATAASRTARDGQVLQAIAHALRTAQLQHEVAYRLLSAEDHDAAEAFRQRRREAEDALLQQGASLIVQRQRWREAELVPRSLRAFAAAVAGASQRPVERVVDRSEFVTHWTRQFRAVAAELSLAKSAAHLEAEVGALLRRALDASFAERARLSDDLAAAGRSLANPDSSERVPNVVLATHPVPARARVREVSDGLRSVLQALPEEIELPDARHPLRSAGTTRRLAPRESVLKAFDQAVAPELEVMFTELEDEHSDVVRDLERARAVVAFGLTSTSNERDDTRQRIAEEARQNARGLLAHRGESLSDRRPQLQPRLVDLAQRAFEPLHEAVSPDGRSLALRRRRARLRAQSGSLGAQLLHDAGRGVATGTRFGASLLDSLLIRIGWKAEPVRERSEVIRRPTLPPALAGDDDGSSISALYAHLFRQDPVAESQFLIGRETELQAIAEARARWEEGHAAAVLVVGERGSGKTSLLNCALLGPLAGISLVRTEFKQRITTPEALRSFLRAQVGAREGTRLEEFLAEERRVIVLEEVERSFLRQIGQYEAVRELQRIITATSRTTLWVLVVNGIAFRLLDPAVRFGQVFSHRIDASSATAQELQAAILFRHNLSGLRLRYEKEEPVGFAARLRDALRRESAEQEFFAGLSLLSDRVYRTAFSLWLRHIKPNADGSISVRAVDNSGADAVVTGLGHVHLFSLLAVLQHGSLTEEEHAAVFALPLDESRSQLNDLLARELLGPEDGRPGYRVRAEALPIVRQALYRRNLL